MKHMQVNASNICIPQLYPLTESWPPLPTTKRGEPVFLDGECGKTNANRRILAYPSGRFVVVRELFYEFDTVEGNKNRKERKRISSLSENLIKTFVYRGHKAQVTCAKFSSSGCYVASGDVRGNIRVWKYDSPSHICKLSISALTGCIRDISWDLESRNICVVGDGSKFGVDPCARVIQWDSGVNVGELSKHARNRCSSCDFRPNRPFHIVTGGMDDFTCLFHHGPPFVRVLDGIPDEKCHSHGSVYCIRYDHRGERIASVGTDGSVCFYDGCSMKLQKRITEVHLSSIYACAWNSTNEFLLTCGADGFVKLIKVMKWRIMHEWNMCDDGFIVGMILGCAFLSGDLPVAVSLSGEIYILSAPFGLLGTKSETILDIRMEKFHRKVLLLSGHQAPVSCVAIDHENSIMYTGDSNGIICKWDFDSTYPLVRVEKLMNNEKAQETLIDNMKRIHMGCITGMILYNENLLSIGWDDSIQFTCDIISSGAIRIPAQPNAITRGTDLIVVVTIEGLIFIRGHKNISEIFRTIYKPISVCISLDDSIIYVGGGDCNIHVYSVPQKGLPLTENDVLSECHLNPVNSLSLSNDGTKLASADIRDVCVWNIKGGNVPLIRRSKWCFHQQRITALTWSNDDTVLASCSDDDSLYLWSLIKPTKKIHYKFAHRGGVTAIEFLRNVDKNRFLLISTGNDGCVNQWDFTEDIRKLFDI